MITPRESKVKALSTAMLRGAFHYNIYTPELVVNKMLNNIDPTGTALVLFNLEIAVALIEDYNYSPSDVSVFVDGDEFKARLVTKMGANVLNNLDTHMKFNTVILNPPYNGVSALHQRFFNTAVSLTKDGGSVIAIQPATAYLSKKPNQKAPNVEMQNNIIKYKTDVRMVPGTVFEGASIITNLSITHLTKIKSDIISLEYVNGTKYDNISLNNINQTEMPAGTYSSIVNKITNYINKNGSMEDITYLSKNESDVYRIAMIRGHGGKSDFYTMVMRDKNKHVIQSANFGFKINPVQKDNVHSYLSAFVARFCLSVYKINGHNDRGEMKMIPLVDLNRSWTDADLCKEFGITTEEYAEILKVIPAYY